MNITRIPFRKNYITYENYGYVEINNKKPGLPNVNRGSFFMVERPIEEMFIKDIHWITLLTFKDELIGLDYENFKLLMDMYLEEKMGSTPCKYLHELLNNKEIELTLRLK